MGATTEEIILDQERQQQNYKLNNLNQHLKKFLEIQDKPTTSYNYKIAIEKYLKFLKENNTEELRNDNSKQLLQEFKSYLLHNQNLASTSIDNYLLRIQSFYSYLNFNVKIKKLNSYKTSTYKYLTIDEIKQLLKSIPLATNNSEIIMRDKAIICLLFTAGLRINELINLKQSDYIKYDDETFIFVTGKGRATDEKENIALANITSSYIEHYLETKMLTNNSNNDYLFTSNHNKQLSRQAINKNLKKYAKKCDELYNTNIYNRCSSHCFRHSLARYLLVNQQLPISQVKDILRHSNIETTAKYLTNSYDEIKKIRQSIKF